jgi:ethanolamine ammonia-lyase small subunit
MTDSSGKPTADIATAARIPTSPSVDAARSTRTSDPFARLRSVTPARVGLGRCGHGLPTRPLLEFELAHARARDAVHEAFEPGSVATAFADRETRIVGSRAPDRQVYLQRPDLGRRLRESDCAALTRGDYDVAFVVADGLSAPAIHSHAVPVLRAVLDQIAEWRVAPIVIACQARVALGDEIGERLGADLVAVLIGERPGLSSPDSLGIYLTWQPRRGRVDSERNCISNVRSPGGLSYELAASRLAWLMKAARRQRLSGVGLKDTSGSNLLRSDDER